MANISALEPFQYHKRLQRLGLVDNPFCPYDDGRYFFPLAEQALSYNDAISLVVEKPLKNINIIVGNPQMGKTQLARRLHSVIRSDPSLKAQSILISGKPVTPANLVKIIASTLGLPHISNNAERMEALRNYLVKQMEERGESLFLVIDTEINLDAMNILLEIGNWYLEFKRPRGKPVNKSLVQVLLIGRRTSPFYAERMFPQIDSLTLQTNNSRTWGTPSILELANLLKKQVVAAGRSEPLFTDEAVDLLIEASQRVPGKLMELANQALLELIKSNGSIITEEMVPDGLDITPPSSQEENTADVQMDMPEGSFAR